jgi:hypothetical protein
MPGKSPLCATEAQHAELKALAGSRDRGEADRARGVLLTLAGWTSPQTAEAFGVREDTVRLWRSDFMKGGAEALKATVAGAHPPREKRGRLAYCPAAVGGTCCRPPLTWRLRWQQTTVGAKV